MDKTGLRFTLRVAGLPDNTFVVVGFTLQEQYSSLFRLELELASADPAVAFAKVLDSSVTLSIWRETELHRTVNGIAVSMEQGDSGFRRTRYQLSVRPALWRTGLKRNSRIFQQQDVHTILETLLKPYGLDDFAYLYRYQRPPREFCVQYQESDLAFAERLCAEEGMFYFFEHDGDKHTLVLADDNVLHKGPVLPYNPAMNAQLQELCIHTLRRRESIRVSGVELKDYTFKNPYWAAEYQRDARGSRDMEHQPRPYSSCDYPGRYKDETGKNVARWRLDGLRNDAHQGEGASNCAALLPGCYFTLTDHPRDEMNTGWQITAVTHSGTQPQALEEEAGEQGTTLSNTFSFIPRNQTWRPSVLEKPKIDGAQIAMVTGPEGEEIYCDEYGRVRVRFLWDRSGITDDRSSCWIRVSQPWAGQHWGGLSIPRVGHEVIVEFLNGDPDQPVIIGRTYHAVNMPPGKLPASKTRTTLRTQTYKGAGFNEVRLDDAKDQQEVFIHAQKDMNTKILNDETVDTQHDRRHQVGNDAHLTVKNEYSETIQANRYTKNEAEEHHLTQLDRKTQIIGNEYKTVGISEHETIGTIKTLEAGMEIHLKSGLQTVIDGGLSLTIKAGGQHIILCPAGIFMTMPVLPGGVPVVGTPAVPMPPLAKAAVMESGAITPVAASAVTTPVVNGVKQIAGKQETIYRGQLHLINNGKQAIANEYYKIVTAKGTILAEGVTDQQGNSVEVTTSEGVQAKVYIGTGGWTITEKIIENEIYNEQGC